MDPQSNLAVMPKPMKQRKQSARVRGQGSLFLRGEIYWMELNWKGTRTRKSLETTDRETALIKLDAEVSAIRSGAMPKSFEPVTVQSLFDTFIMGAELRCKARTIADYKSRWEVHLKSAFGPMIATAITKDKITAYLHKRMQAGASLCTRNREQRVLQMVFEDNRKKLPADHFPEFPAYASERQQVRKGRLSKEDYAKLRARLDDPKVFWLKAFVTLAFTYGFRRSELINTKVDYFDDKASTLTLPAFTTKNKAERVVDLNPGGEIFRMLVQLTEGRAADAAMFVRNGKPVKDYRGEWAKQTADIKGGSGKGGAVTLHDLRRSAITNMSEKGVTAAQAGTHLTTDVFARYIQRNQSERRATAAKIEGE